MSGEVDYWRDAADYWKTQCLEARGAWRARGVELESLRRKNAAASSAMDAEYTFEYARDEFAKKASAELRGVAVHDDFGAA